MEDRLLEFQKMSGVSQNVSIQSTEDGEDSRDFLPRFNAKTKLLQQAINQIQYNNQEILKQKEKHRDATLNDVERNISDKINRLIDQNNVLSMTVKDELVKMQKDIEDSKIEQENNRQKLKETLKQDIPASDEPELRMKIISYQSLSNKFSNVLKETQSIQLEYKSTVKDKLARQAKIYDNKLSQEEIEEIISDPQGMEKLVSGIMMGGGAHTKIQNALSDIQDKYNDIIKLEKSVEIMHQMFIDMALLVHANGETLNSVENNVNQAGHYVKMAVGQLDKAQKDHKAAKKWKMIICVAIIVIALLILWPILHVI